MAESNALILISHRSYHSERSYLSKLVTGAIVGYCPLHSSSPVAAQCVVRVNKNKD